jgi:hypothetical protein
MAEKPIMKFSKAHQFHILKDLFAYARSEGFTNGELQGCKTYLKKQRTKYPRNNREWRVMTHHFSRKDWDKHTTDPEWYSTRILQIKRDRGDWLARIIDTQGYGWTWARNDFSDGSWSNPIVHIDSRKPNVVKVWERPPEMDPDYLEI